MIIEISTESIFLELLDNAVLTWTLIACGLAQVSKLIFELIKFKKWRPAVLFETGGMPSSHSALVSGTASGLGIELGFDDPVFALAAIIAFIVMYDASGIRRAAGLTAATVNKLTEKKDSELIPPLKESLGHTRAEVIVGSFLGPIVVIPGIVFIGSLMDFIHIFNLALG
tara:strand:+ start:7656 stop:8165 length:510 start_codon:yes stop_codon:yes gene_type:complete